MRLHLFIPALAAALALPAAAFAQTGPTREEGTEKINQVLVYGDQPCPPGSADEIVVCARMPDEFRIPEGLRGDPNAPQNQAWGARASTLEYQSRTGIGSCSPSGSGGATGCFNQLVRQAREERKQGLNWVGMVEDKRQERLGTIDEKSDAIEARVKAEEAEKKAAEAESKKPE